jgi:hypothetical protein
LDDTLPNGLHDAELLGLSVSFERGTATLAVKIDISNDAKPLYAAAEIRLSGLVAFVMEGPQELVNLQDSVGISSFETSEQHYPAFANFAPEIKKIFHSLYLEEPWNSYIHIGARSAALVWKDTSANAEQK